MLTELELELLLQREKLDELNRRYVDAFYNNTHDDVLDELDIEKQKVQYAIDVLKQLKNRQ